MYHHSYFPYKYHSVEPWLALRAGSRKIAGFQSSDYSQVRTNFASLLLVIFRSIFALFSLLFSILFKVIFWFSALKHSPSKRGKRDSIKKLISDRDAQETSTPAATTSNNPTAPTPGAANITQPSGNGKMFLISFLVIWL